MYSKWVYKNKNKNLENPISGNLFSCFGIEFPEKKFPVIDVETEKIISDLNSFENAIVVWIYFFKFYLFFGYK